MAQLTIRKTWNVNGVPTNPTSVTLGVVQDNSGAAVLDAGTVMPQIATGIYEYTLPAVDGGTTYTATVVVVYAAETYTFTIVAAGDILTLSYNTTSHVLTVTSARRGIRPHLWRCGRRRQRQRLRDAGIRHRGDGVSFPTYTEPGVTSVTITIAADPAAVIAALITAGVLQYVSGSSGPLQFTATAVAHVPTPAVVNISTEDTIEENNPRPHWLD